MTKETIEYLPVADIDTALQVRECANDESIRNLSVTLSEVGLQQPIRVRRSGERFIVLDGERRLLGARLLKWNTIAAIIEEREISSSETMQRQVIANGQRKNLSSMEVARAIDALIKETGWSATEVARKLGISVATVSKLRALLDLPSAVQEQVQTGALPYSKAYDLKNVNDPAKRSELVERAVNGELPRDAISVEVKKSKRGRKSAKRSRKTSVHLPVGDKCRMALTGAGDIKAFVACLQELVRAAETALAEGLEWSGFINAARAGEIAILSLEYRAKQPCGCLLATRLLPRRSGVLSRTCGTRRRS